MPALRSCEGIADRLSSHQSLHIAYTHNPSHAAIFNGSADCLRNSIDMYRRCAEQVRDGFAGGGQVRPCPRIAGRKS